MVNQYLTNPIGVQVAPFVLGDEMKLILDACCGGRMFYFDKNNPNVLFADIRNQKLSFKDRDKSWLVKKYGRLDED